jgi:hypothetical protein
MRLHSRLVLLLATAVVTVSATWPFRSEAPAALAAALPAADATARIVSAAHALMTTLDDSGRTKLQFPFDGPQKTRWSNLPTGIFERKGLRMGDLSPAQRAAVTNLLTAVLSRDGYRKVTEIIGGDEALHKANAGPPGGAPPGGTRVIFGEDEYFLAFLGTPSTSAPWMLQFGGHHLAINLTLAGSQSSMTPSLPATQPARYTVEGREIRPLGAENDKAFALVNALDASQRSKAILTYGVSDLVLGPGHDGQTIQPEGIPASALSASQQLMLLDLVHEWAGIVTDAFAAPRMAEIKATLPQTYFAWSGPTMNGSMAYFRIQGPTLVIEYAPQRSVDHIHTIYRDPTNDYGAKFAGK